MRSTEIDTPVLVIGYGNVLRGDDGAGPAAAQALREKLPPQTAEVLSVHQLLPELSERLSRSGLAIFIDADWSVPAGQVRQKALTAGIDGDKVIGHHQSPQNLLNMAGQLYGRAPPAILFNVGAASFGYQEGLSTPVRRAIPKLVREVVRTVINPEHHHA